MTQPAIRTVVPDRGYPWITYPWITTGTVTFDVTTGSSPVLTLPTTPWVLTAAPGGILSGPGTPVGDYPGTGQMLTDSGAGYLSPFWPGISVSDISPIRLLDNGTIELRSRRSGNPLVSVTFSSTDLARRFGFSTVGPHAAVGGVVTSTDQPGYGAWWCPNVGSMYAERATRRMYSTEPAATGQPSVSNWGTYRRGILQAQSVHRARIFQDARVTSNFYTPAGLTGPGTNGIGAQTLEQALAAAADGLPWRLTLNNDTTPLERDVWVSDVGALSSVDSLISETDPGRLYDITIPLTPFAP